MQTLDVIVKIAGLIVVLLALSPHLKKAIDMIRHAPPRDTDEDVHERIKLRLRNMGWFQQRWEDFLWWARREGDELLSWKERRNRAFWCPLFGHKGTIGKMGDVAYHMTCRDCHDTGTGDTEASVEAWRKSGRATWRAARQRRRPDIGKAA